MFLFPRKHRQVLGVDITPSSIKLIELTLSGGQYTVDAYAAEPTPQNSMNEKAIVDADAVGEAIARAVRRAGVRTKDVAVAISGDAAALPSWAEALVRDPVALAAKLDKLSDVEVDSLLGALVNERIVTDDDLHATVAESTR